MEKKKKAAPASKSAKSLTTEEIAQALYNDIDNAIRNLSREDAVDVLEKVSGHCDGVAEGIREEMDEKED